jgi:hypothetical protein
VLTESNLKNLIKREREGEREKGRTPKSRNIQAAVSKHIEGD